MATITGYAAIWFDGSAGSEFRLEPGIVERIHRHAFDAALKRGDDTVCTFNHSSDVVLGRSTAKTLRLSTDSKGLRYSADAPNTPDANGLVELLRRGDINASSFAFEVEDEAWSELPDGRICREIRSVRLHDVSCVTHAAYKGTSAGIRSAPTAPRAMSAEVFAALTDVYEEEDEEIPARLA